MHDPNAEFLSFDPNQKPAKVWATYIPYRSPSWKLYSNRGGAISAMAVGGYRSWRSSRAAALFFFDGEKWVRVAYKLPKPPENCQICRDSVMVPATSPHRLKSNPNAADNEGQYLWVRSRGKVADPPTLEFVCDDCAKDPRYHG